MVGDIQETVGIISRVHNHWQGAGTKAASILSCSLRDEQELEEGGRGHSPSEVTRGSFNEETLRSSAWPRHRNLKVKIVSDDKLAGEIGRGPIITGLINHVYDFRSNPTDTKKPGSGVAIVVFQKPTLPVLWRTRDRVGGCSDDPGQRQWL